MKITSTHPEVFCKTGVSINFVNFTGRNVFRDFYSINLKGPKACYFIKKRRRHFPVNLREFSDYNFLQNIFEQRYLENQ